MWKQKIQQSISFLLIFFLLFSFTFRIPTELFFAWKAYAGDKEFYNLVSIIVDEESYDGVKSKLVRYSRDIQATLENTRVVILPTPSDASVLDIASINESLFFEWYKAHKNVDYESRLIWTVLVWKIPVPVVFDASDSGRSILPYVDFEDKSYIFNHESGKYEKSEKALSKLIPEVWHGVISPNTGNEWDDIQAINDYLDKNHDFYTGQWVFDQEKWVIDWEGTPAEDDYEPYVFYYDQFRENQALQYQKYTGYEMYMQNIEDITYNRYSKDLARKVSDQVLGIQNAELQDLLIAVDPEFDISGIESGPDVNASSDILTRYITDNSTKKFLEIFNGSTLWEMRKHVYNAGRYNDGGSKVNMDMPPFLVSVLDQVSGEIIKNVNTSLETEITDIVKNWLSRDIALIDSVSQPKVWVEKSCTNIYTGYYYGQITNDITSADQCSIYAGSTENWGTLVESNRWYNINNVWPDTELCGLGIQYNNATARVTDGLSGFWGNNTPINLQTNEGNYTDFQLWVTDPYSSIRPIYDILGSKEIEDETKIPSPIDCFQDFSLIQTTNTYEHHYTTKSWDDDREDHYICRTKFVLPLRDGDGVQYYQNYASKSSVLGINNSPTATTNTSRFCAADNMLYSASIWDLWDIFQDFTDGVSSWTCTTQVLNIGGQSYTRANNNECITSGWEDSTTTCSCDSVWGINTATFSYTTIPSHILHTSPTDKEFGLQTQSFFTPSLPIDSDRYIDFIWANGGNEGQDYGYQRIDFPQLFRVSLDLWDDVTLENTAEKIKQHLDNVSLNINSVIDDSSPAALSVVEQNLYNKLKTWDYPDADIDLYKILQDKPLEIFSLDNESKEISYFDTLVFAVFWNNLNTVSSKYKFIFQEYLSNEFEGNDYGFHLPKAKKSYEIAYMAAPGDAQNMYVKLDPELKGIHPYADTISANIALQTTINAANVGDPISAEWTFECAPPDGVNIFQWIPAVICWLTEMLPPTIKISSGSCGDDVNLSDEEKEEIQACSIDENKNGVSDCIEEKLVGGSIRLLSDAGKYFYNSSGILISEIFTKDDELASFDSSSYISHNLSRVVIPDDSDEVFNESNSIVIYDKDIPSLSTDEARKQAATYISFSDIELRAHRWATKTYFYSKWKDANIYFESSLTTQDISWNIIVDIESNTLEIGVRGDRLFISSYLVDGPWEYIADTSIIASDQANVCIVDGWVTSLEQSSIEANSISDAKEKLLLLIQNFSQSGNSLAINYPLSVELIYNNERVFYQQDLTVDTIGDVYSLLNLSKSGRYEAHIRDSDGFHSYRVFDVIAEKATKIETILWSNIIETWWNISTHILTVLDRYDNAATGDIYTIEMSLDGGGLVFDDNGEEEIEYQIVEWYKAFRLKSTSRDEINTLTISVTDVSWNIVEQETHTLRTIDTIDLDFSLIWSIPKVWGDIYTYNVEFLDKNGNLLTDLNSRVYFGINKIYGRALTPFTPVVWGKSQVSFSTSMLAARNINVELQLEGGNDIYNESITIFPDIAIKIDLNLSADKIEATSDESAVLEATLKDRYNNEVFTDNATILDIEIHERSQNIISVDATQKTVQDGKVQFKISGTDIPGLGYFKVSSDPDLSMNSFDLIGQAPFNKVDLTIPTMISGDSSLTSTGRKFYKEYSTSKYISKFISEQALTQSEAYNDLAWVLQSQVLNFWNVTNSLTVAWLWENAGSVETFFFWDSDDITGNAYNSMYSVLLWAPYGDISKENYLGWEILFDRNNSALAVSSLINTPYKFSDSISFEDTGHISVNRSGDITQDIELVSRFDVDWRLVLDIHNNALETYIWRAYYNLTDASDITLSVDEDAWYSVEFNGNDAVVMSPLWQVVFEAYESGRFERHSWLTTQVDTSFSGEGIIIALLMWWQIIGQVHIKSALKTNVTRDENILQAKLNSLEDTIILYIASNGYSSRKVQSDEDSESLKLYYQDPFASKYVLNDFHNNDTIWFESSQDESGIGWQDSNTMLLSFAAWESVWRASMRFHSFSLINLWDPVASLKPLKNVFKNSSIEKSFDPTLWEIVDDSEGLIWYQVFDYNNDAREDILTIHRDGYVALHENDEIEGWFIFQRDLVFAADGWSVRMVKTGDFSWDGYDDIFFVTEKGEPALYNNHEKDFYRYDIVDQMSLSWAIIQVETYDMDDDWKDDIITLDDAGEIHIFYGNGEAETPLFTQKFIGDGYAIELSNTATSHGGWVYYDWLTQLSDDRATKILLNSQEYLTTLSWALANWEEGNTPEFIDESLVESFLYMSLPYIPTDYESPFTNEEIVEEALWNDESVTQFLDNYENYTSYSWLQNAYNTQTYFLRSQYADSEGIVINKTFTDTTPPHLQTGDSVYYDISIKNTSSTRKNNIAYVDSIPAYFHFASQDLIVLTQDNLSVPRKLWVDQYEILLDGFFLDPGEETIVRYELTTLPLSYGYMQVWLYEQGEVWDDIYGDIILKDDEQNCGRQADIYRSTAIRSYSAGSTIPNCEASDIDVGNSFPELTDEDGNGVPDYLDSMLGEDDESLQRVIDYGEEIREELWFDSDGDGIPDSDDTMDNTDSATDFMWALDSINESIDEISDDIDELIQWLSCWFGGWSCIATPLNWAPLAPGNDPTLFGKPIGDGLRVWEGFPIFSALTGQQMSCWLSPCCLPSVHPATSATFIPGPFCGGPGAWWRLGVNSPTNFVRMFATPTLTGGFGIAVCFWGPASVAGNSVPMWVSPIVPGWNCIVAAMPLMSCEWWEGDPGVLGYPYPWNGFGLIHANCEWGTQNDLHTPLELESNFVSDYLEYLQTGVQPAGMYDNYIDAFSTLADWNSGDYYLPSEPLINIGGWWDSSMSTSVSLDSSALWSWNFEDVIKIDNKRVAPFPWFMMDWVERQLDEITSKLTNLPKIFVILPDFGGIFDYSFSGFWDGLSEAFQNGKNNSDNERKTHENKTAALNAQKSDLDCSGTDAFKCRSIDLKLVWASGQKYANSWKETLSWIREVYEFIWNIPLINLETETIAVNVPWIEPASIDRALIDWNASLQQWKWQLESKSEAWSWGGTCSGTDTEIAACQSKNDIKKKAYADTSAFVGSLERNIQTLREYKEFPDKLAKLINIKEVWLEQILCNIDAISKLVWEWVSSNGERFKAWVELYILIKAILKSWQLFIDVFTWYEEECHECKNERQDLQDFTFQLISAVIPSPPIIQFPKWPDIILDLHNIRAWMTIYMPDFDINMRPIVLPTLPLLGLPDVPSIGFSLPSMPQLPSFEIPELPDLPTLPTIELPDLPPPPKIPKLFGSVEIVLNIMKLITKAMCILKGSPFVPEWRAGDQIAFLTERNGYLPTDFIDIQPPAFSYSAISAIKVTTYVNLEFEMEFILEAVRSITAPLDKISNNIANMLDISLSNIDLSEAVPSNINLDIELDGESKLDISLAPLDENPEWILFIAGLINSKFIELISYMGDNAHLTMTNGEFTTHVWGQLASNSITSNPRTQELQNLWSEVFALSYSAEDAFIEELQNSNREKFQTLEDIISTEIEYSQQQQKNLEDMWAPNFIIQVSEQTNGRIEWYNTLMQPYNMQTLDAAIHLVSWESKDSKKYRDGIEQNGADLMNTIRGGLQSYKNNSLLAADWDTTSWADAGGGTCHSSSAYEYVYEWIYVLEDGKNYKLFDYTDTLKWDEKLTLSDLDSDGDDDVLYLMNGKLYFKENRKNTEEKQYFSLPPLILDINDNKFYNGEVYHEAINGFKEVSVSDGAINVEFSRPTNPEIKNFRMDYHTIVDKYLDESDSFIPSTVQTHIVDAIADIDSLWILEETSDYRVFKHLATLSYAWWMNGVKLTNDKMQNIREQLENNVLITLTSGTPIYASNNDFEITYQLWNAEEEILRVEQYSSVSFNAPTKILSLSWNAYVSMGISVDIENTDLIDHIWMPLLPGAHIEFDGDISALDESSHIDIRYYDGSEIQMDMREIEGYRLYDLGDTFERAYIIRLQLPNDFYYARMRGFKDNIESTLSRQILLAPQIYSDTLAPQIGLTQKIRVPVYQKHKIDLTPYIYEDGGLSGISELRIDFDLGIDSDGDGNPKNDADSENITITKTAAKIEIEFGPYDELFERDILIALEDDNGNIGSREVGFEVYPPIPTILDIQENTITGVIDEDLLNEPVRLYRYRWGIIQKLQAADGTDLIETDVDGNYDFETAEDSDGLVLSYSGTTIATIDEYTGRIDISDILTSTLVLATNDPLNSSVYPEVQILRLATPIFRQFVKIPEGEVSTVSNFNSLENTGIYMKLINQEQYSSFRIPLWVTYNPGSVSVHASSDESKAPVMTIFKDGRIIIDLDNFKLEYRTLWEDSSLVLVDKTTWVDVAQVVFHMNASYVLR
jgi:uncharacterized repeat protein (TIGR01451 family)